LSLFKKIIFKVLLLAGSFCFIVILVNSSLDLYNNFAYDKAIIKDNPYGYTPMLRDVYNYSSSQKDIHSGDFVYVEDWISAYNGRVVFAKVRSKFDMGYINNDLLVKTNINVIPLFSALTLLLMFVYAIKTIYKKIII
jgi:hypothetical protein